MNWRAIGARVAASAFRDDALANDSLHGVLLAGQFYTEDHGVHERRRSHIHPIEPFGLQSGNGRIGPMLPMIPHALGYLGRG